MIHPVGGVIGEYVLLRSAPYSFEREVRNVTYNPRIVVRERRWVRGLLLLRVEDQYVARRVASDGSGNQGWGSPGPGLPDATVESWASWHRASDLEHDANRCPGCDTNLKCPLTPIVFKEEP